MGLFGNYGSGRSCICLFEGRLHWYGQQGEVGEERSKPFRVACGLRQGCILSSLLFSLYINSLVNKLKEAEVGVMCTCRGQLISALLYADDAVIFAEDKELMRRCWTLWLKGVRSDQ